MLVEESANLAPDGAKQPNGGLMKRIGIIALLHESNTFLEEPTTLEHFRANLLADGDDVIGAFQGSQHEVGGFIDALVGHSEIETVGIFGARAMPYGMITADCWQTLMTRLETALRGALPLDGLLVAPHGATVADGAADADGDWLERVRTIVGPDMPIIGTLDLHANVSQKMVLQCQALFGYRTNPHLDQRARGIDAGRTMIRTLRGEISPKSSLVQLPLCVNIERQATSEQHGRQLWREADRLQSLPGMLSVSCLYGFPYSDVNEMGASVVAVTEHSVEQARAVAAAMAQYWWNRRSTFTGRLVSVDDAIQMAIQLREQDTLRPVGLLEMGDNVGGGSPGDGTWIVHGWLAAMNAASPPTESGTLDLQSHLDDEASLGVAIHSPLEPILQRRTPSSGLSATFSPWKGAKGQERRQILTVIADPDAVEASVLSGAGHSVKLSVGGKLDPHRHGPPIDDTFRVTCITDGRFSEPEVRHGGYSHFDQGTTAVLEGSSGVTIIATTGRVAPMSLQQVLSQGLHPEDFAVIVIKGVHAPVAAYQQACSRLIRVNTRGATTADVHELTFLHRRRPMEPFETVETWQA